MEECDSAEECDAQVSSVGDNASGGPSLSHDGNDVIIWDGSLEKPHGLDQDKGTLDFNNEEWCNESISTFGRYQDARTSFGGGTVGGNTFASCLSVQDSNDDDSSQDLNINTNTYPLEEQTAYVVQRQSRQGARCPVHGIQLIASGDQLYAPYLQRPPPITDEILQERRRLQSGSRFDTDAKVLTFTMQHRIMLAERLQKPKLLSDMCAFKAANPGSVFQDFINWYGNPSNPLEECDNGSNTNRSFNCLALCNDNAVKEADDASLVLTSTRSFWSNTWDEAEPKSASDQNPLFDAINTVEMLLLAFETMHPAHLMNQVLAVNFSLANFILNSSGLGYRIGFIKEALTKLSRKTEQALLRLGRDMVEGTGPSINSAQDEGEAFVYTSPSTIAACEEVCDQIGDVEILLSRAVSLLSKFPGEFNLVEQLLKRPEGDVINVDNYKGRVGILKVINKQQQRNSGREQLDINTNDLPFPSVREYILQKCDDDNYCQLSARIGGAHGLEEGGTNSTKGGLVLALSKCLLD